MGYPQPLAQPMESGLWPCHLPPSQASGCYLFGTPSPISPKSPWRDQSLLPFWRQPVCPGVLGPTHLLHPTEKGVRPGDSIGCCRGQWGASGPTTVGRSRCSPGTRPNLRAVTHRYVTCSDTQTREACTPVNPHANKGAGHHLQQDQADQGVALWHPARQWVGAGGWGCTPMV